MNNYRLCVNKGGFWKIQMWRRPKKYFPFITFMYTKEEIQGKWEDVCFQGFNNECVKFKIREEAEEKMNQYIDIDLADNEDWCCDE